VKLKIKYFFIIVILHSFIPSFVFSQGTMPKDVQNAIAEGSSKKLASFFNNNIELNIKNKEDVYSKAQAQLIIKDFFKKNKPKHFNIISEGVNSDLHYAICSLKTLYSNYRVYIIYRKIRKNTVIHKLEINTN